MDGWSVLSALKGDRALARHPGDHADHGRRPRARLHARRVRLRDQAGQSPAPVADPEEVHLPRTRPVPCSWSTTILRPARSTRAMLEKEGWAVSEAENGSRRLQSMERERPSLIFLDLMMPEMDGFAFAAEVRRHPEWRSIPIVVVTAQDLTNDDRTAAERQCRDDPAEERRLARGAARAGARPARRQPRHAHASASIAEAARHDHDPHRRRQRDEPRHAVAAARAQGLRGAARRRRRDGHRRGPRQRARPDPDGHEPSGHGRLGSDAAPEGRRRTRSTFPSSP